MSQKQTDYRPPVKKVFLDAIKNKTFHWGSYKQKLRFTNKNGIFYSLHGIFCELYRLEYPEDCFWEVYEVDDEETTTYSFVIKKDGVYYESSCNSMPDTVYLWSDMSTASFDSLLTLSEYYQLVAGKKRYLSYDFIVEHINSCYKASEDEQKMEISPIKE